MSKRKRAVSESHEPYTCCDHSSRTKRTRVSTPPTTTTTTITNPAAAPCSPPSDSSPSPYGHPPAPAHSGSASAPAYASPNRLSIAEDTLNSTPTPPSLATSSSEAPDSSRHHQRDVCLAGYTSLTPPPPLPSWFAEKPWLRVVRSPATPPPNGFSMPLPEMGNDPDFGRKVCEQFAKSQNRDSIGEPLRDAKYGQEVARRWRHGWTPEDSRQEWALELERARQEFDTSDRESSLTASSSGASTPPTAVDSLEETDVTCKSLGDNDAACKAAKMAVSLDGAVAQID